MSHKRTAARYIAAGGIVAILWWGYVCATWHVFLLLEGVLPGLSLPEVTALVRRVTVPPWGAGVLGTLLIASACALFSRPTLQRVASPSELILAAVVLLLCILLWTGVAVMIGFVIYPIGVVP
jgi:hypothetical protein